MRPIQTLRAWIGVALLVGLGGCTGFPTNTDLPEPLPAIFHIDKIRYWWEGSEFVVNVTFTNVSGNYTPGIDSLDPDISVIVREEAPNPESTGLPGQETKEIYPEGSMDSVHVVLQTSEHDPWKTRWRQSVDGAGPILIPPGTSLSMEFGFTLGTDFHNEQDGHYEIDVYMPSWYPSYMQKPRQHALDAEYNTGCFNRNVPEFYGVKANGLDCVMWNCAHEYTSEMYGRKDWPKRTDPATPTCAATDALPAHY